MDNRFSRWWHANAPTRESLEKSRVLAPVAHRVLEPSLWRFSRRSVPRGVALGLFVFAQRQVRQEQRQEAEHQRQEHRQVAVGGKRGDGSA